MAADMATKNYFSHTDSSNRAYDFDWPLRRRNGRQRREHRSRLHHCPAGHGYWKASSGHNTNMLGASYKQIGIGALLRCVVHVRLVLVTDSPASTTDVDRRSPTRRPLKPAPQLQRPPRRRRARSRHCYEDEHCHRYGYYEAGHSHAHGYSGQWRHQQPALHWTRRYPATCPSPSRSLAGPSTAADCDGTAWTSSTSSPTLRAPRER